MSSTAEDLEILRGFLNTVDVEGGTDELGTVESAKAWFAGLGWLDDGAVLSPEDVEDIRRLRTTLRSMALDNAGHNDTGDSPIEIGGRGLLVVEIVDGEPRLVAVGSGADRLLGRLLALLYEEAKSGSWPRLKICGNEECRWAYYDRSKNSSRRWCSSEGCGNLIAARNYRARKRSDV